MKTLLFSTSTDFDFQLVTLMGASIKPQSASPIGHFGTGLKYAIAIILRYGGNIEIHTPSHHATFQVVRKLVRRQELALISMCLDGTSQILPFTLAYGQDWEPWMAVRELYSNTLDEGGTVRELPLEREPLELRSPSSQTHILVQGAEFIDAWEHSEGWLLPASLIPLDSTPEVEVYFGNSPAVYYRRIKVLSLPRPSALTYNILSEVPLSEDRAINSFTFHHLFEPIAARSLTSGYVLRQLCAPPEGTWEEGWGWYSLPSNLSPQFLSALKSVAETDFARIPRPLLDACQSTLPFLAPPAAKLTPSEQAKLAQAVKFLASMGATFSQEVQVVEDCGNWWSGRLAATKDSKTFLLHSALAEDAKSIAKVLFKEYCYATYNFSEYSREFQTFLLDRYLEMQETALGVSL